MSRNLAAIAVVGLLFAQAVWAAPKYRVLHYFNGTDGAGPWGGVTLDSKGNVYGTTAGGGACGTVFRLTPQTDGHWKESILYQFGSGHAPCDPNSSVIFDGKHNLYATTVGGGTYLAGTVFELIHGSTGWAESTLYSFGTQNGDGGGPTAGLAMDKAGNLYGTTPKGSPWSTVFELTPGSGGWNETVLYRFCMSMPVCEDGTAPYAGVILDAAGNLYGTTYGGGAYNGGTVYEVQHMSVGWKETVLHSFAANYTDGHTPGWGSLLMDSSGRLYGTTVGGGCCGGVVFKLSPQANGQWKESILHNFKDPTGFEPNAGVVMDKAGNLYGTTVNGGTYECGVIYKLAPKANGAWKYTVLHIFSAQQGCSPEGNLVLDQKGNLYGGTAIGGPANGGVVFELTP